MKAASLVLLCGVLLIIGLPVFKAEQRRGYALGRWGGSSHHRFLLQEEIMPMMMWWEEEEIESEASQPPPRDSPTERGQGAKDQSEEDTVPPSYHGPTVKSTSGALAVSNGLTTGYPKEGISCAIPATSASQRTYDTSRPYAHTFPGGYTLLFIPFYSVNYTGYHWSIYDNNNKFYSFDDGDATSGEYDYDDSEDLPTGCQYIAWQPSDTLSSTNMSALQPSLAASGASVSNFLSAPAFAPSNAVGAAAAPAYSPASAAHTSKGARTSAMPSSYIAPAPAPGRSPRNATLEAAKQDALLSAMEFGKSGMVKLLCKPIAAKRDPPSHTSKAVNLGLGLGLGLGIPAAAFLILVCVAAYIDDPEAAH